MKTSESIIQAVSEIERILNANPAAASNPFVPRQIRFIANQLGGHDTYAAEKAHRIAELSEIFYSARKHMKYPGGAASLRAEMIFDLIERMRSQAQARKTNND